MMRILKVIALVDAFLQQWSQQTHFQSSHLAVHSNYTEAIRLQRNQVEDCLLITTIEAEATGLKEEVEEWLW